MCDASIPAAHQRPNSTHGLNRVVFLAGLLSAVFTCGVFFGAVYSPYLRSTTTGILAKLDTSRSLPSRVVHNGDDIRRELELAIRRNEDRKRWLEEQARLNRFTYHRLRVHGNDPASSQCMELVKENQANEREIATLANRTAAARILSARLAEAVPKPGSADGNATQTSLNDAVRWLAEHGSLESRPTVPNEQWRLNEPPDRYMGLPE